METPDRYYLRNPEKLGGADRGFQADWGLKHDESDIEYIRADLARPPERHQRLVEAAKEWMARLDNTDIDDEQACVKYAEYLHVASQVTGINYDLLDTKFKKLSQKAKEVIDAETALSNWSAEFASDTLETVILRKATAYVSLKEEVEKDI